MAEPTNETAQTGKRAQRGRPEMSAKRRADMQGRITDVARALFQETGFANVSMRRIAKELGCTPMTLYGYYDGKIDILRSLWGGVLEDVFTRLEALPKSPDSADYLSNLCITYVEFWFENPHKYRLVFMAEGVTQPDVSLFVGNPDIILRYGIFAHAIAEIMPDSQMDTDIKTRVDFLLSALHGISHNHITMSGYEWTSVERQVACLIRGIS